MDITIGIILGLAIAFLTSFTIEYRHHIDRQAQERREIRTVLSAVASEIESGKRRYMQFAQNIVRNREEMRLYPAHNHHSLNCCGARRKRQHRNACGPRARHGRHWSIFLFPHTKKAAGTATCGDGGQRR